MPAVGERSSQKLPLLRLLLSPGPTLRRPNNNFAGAEPDTDEHAFGLVYANDGARDLITANSTTPFPPGAIIVREKLATATSPSPELIAVMVKREKGFNPAANDWEFAVVNGTATQVTHREKTGSCQQCHASEAKNDFVFRSYIK